MKRNKKRKRNILYLFVLFFLSHSSSLCCLSFSSPLVSYVFLKLQLWPEALPSPGVALVIEQVLLLLLLLVTFSPLSTFCSPMLLLLPGILVFKVYIQRCYFFTYIIKVRIHVFGQRSRVWVCVSVDSFKYCFTTPALFPYTISKPSFFQFFPFISTVYTATPIHWRWTQRRYWILYIQSLNV